MTATLYDVLGVEPDADLADLRRAYLSLAQQHHPDRPGGDAARMREVNDAWATLGNPVRRQRYDATLRTPSPHRTASTTRSSSDSYDWYDDRGLDLDDRPIGPPVVLPRWLAMIPVGLFALSMALFGLGVLFAVPPMLGAALMCFALSVLLFFAAPFLALYSSRRPNR